ncbi:type IV-A pilus assembly ATPase PilB [gamma proteobacterium HTCC5015]|nr:type IV-A pilus assembly ATPase PilB [gamma proteobacterium HTCC5015]
MATTEKKLPPLTGFPRKLVLKEVLTEEAAQQALAEAQKNKQSFIDYAVGKKVVSAKAVAGIASQEFGLPSCDLAAIDIDPETTKLVDHELLKKHQAVPLAKRGSRLFLAISDPLKLSAVDDIKFNTGLTTEPILVEHDKLLAALESIENDTGSGLDDLDDDLEDLDLAEEEQESDASDPAAGADDTPVVKYVNKVLLDAINKGASDIHFEPYEKFTRVRFRVDGMLKEINKPPTSMTPRIIARIKVMSRMDISERRVPQDGRIKLKLSKTRAIDFRVNTCPTLFGEKIVLRILDPSSANLGIDMLGYEPEQKEAYMRALNNPYGMILVTGPTGSGKTVSLYTGLNILNTEERNISTAEDPAEINLPGINQVNVNPKQGLDFSSALKAFLRQDPDIIMVGEIRDLETASIAIKAAQTGHMVMSTLHTNDAPQTLARMINMGVPAFNLATAVNLIIAQRLARRLCSECKEPDDIPREALLEAGFKEDEVDDLKLYKAVGCPSCNEGYKGRVGIYQVMPISEATSKLIMQGANAIELGEQAAKEGINDIRRSGLLKVKQGVTSLAECNRVTMD